MKIAVVGCCHGELEKIYNTLQFLERSNNIRVDLLLICGDFQAVRNWDDLSAMAVPPKYQKLNTFHKYYSGEKVAPVLTIFIGGNHEASNYMQELPYGGWVAKNIYFMGYANVIQVGGLRIGGLSGIYKERDYYRGHYEYAPYTEETKRSVYHIRNLEVFRLKQLSHTLDIFMSHDWPSNIAHYGNMTQLFIKKPYLRTEVLDGSLGSPPAAELLNKLQPSYWFSAHLHVKYSANVQHSTGKCTRFLSLDKCLPRRQFLQVLDFKDKGTSPVSISLDPEWLCILKSTNHLLSLTRSSHFMPGLQSAEGSDFEVLDEDMDRMRELFGGDLRLPENFKPTAPTLQERMNSAPPAPPVLVNEQTALLCTMLELTDPNAVHLGISSHDFLTLEPDDRELLANKSDKDDDSSASADASSSLSFINSSLELSPTSSSPSITTVPPVPQVSDDDEEFQAILAAQRRSQQMTPAASTNMDAAEQDRASSNDDTGKLKNNGLGDFEVLDQENSYSTDSPAKVYGKYNSPEACSVETEADTNQVTVKAKLSLTSSQQGDVDRSSSDIDSTSQDSQDELQGYQADCSHSSTTDYVEKSTGSESPMDVYWPAKHLSPNSSNSDDCPSAKKLKRRNVSLYSSGAEENLL